MIPTHQNIKRSPSPPISPALLQPSSPNTYISRSPQLSQPVNANSPPYQNRKVVYVPQNGQNVIHNPEHPQHISQVHHQNQQKRQEVAITQPRPP